MSALRGFLTAAAIAMVATGRPAQAQTGSPQTAAPERAVVEVALTWGQGGYNYADDNPGWRDVVSADVCVFCDGRRALFVEYSHWGTPRASYNTSYRSADSVTAGLRLQGSQRVRPFFDAGVVVGNSRFRRLSGVENRMTVGGAIGGGVMVPVRRLYLRVDSGLIIMSDLYLAVNLTAGVGWRF